MSDSKPCEVCDYHLDDRGQCASCAGVLPEDFERVKHVTVQWTVCSIHGAHEANRDQLYRMSWKTRDPKDRRRKMAHHEWRYRCAKCVYPQDGHEAQSFKERILLPAHVYQPKIDERLARWKR